MAIISTTKVGTALQSLLQADDIAPGTPPSYELCKTIYAYHPLGAKIAEEPLTKAQSQARDITIPKGPEDRLREQFLRVWGELECDKHIFNLGRQARIYGVASLALLAEGVPNRQPIKPRELPKLRIAFNVFDPLNTAGSLVLNQNPLALDYQKVRNIMVGGEVFHPSRAVVLLNEDPLFIQYTASAFGFSGRSCYQRALYPLKSYVQAMVADDMVSRKAGLLVMMLKAQGSIIDNLMAGLTGIKRALLQSAATDNVLSVGENDKVESINLENVNGALTASRRNILENIAAGVPMPAKLLLQESFAEGFGEGTEDSKYVAEFVDWIRKWLNPAYHWFDVIVRHRAWDEEFYKTIQTDYPEQYGSVPYLKAFMDWSNSFATAWPSLLREPPSEEIKVEDVKLKAVIGLLEVLIPRLDPENVVTAIQWACDQFNELKLLFGASPLLIDAEALANYKPEPQQAGEGENGFGEEPKPPKFADTAAGRELRDAVARLVVDKSKPQRIRERVKLAS